MVVSARHARAAGSLRRAGPLALLAALTALATTVGPLSGTSVNDLYVYSVYGDLLHHGAVPYRDFGLEYPPLALVPIWLPQLIGDQALWTGVEMGVCALVASELLRALGGERAAWLWALSPLVLGAQVRTHFDMAAVPLVLGALLALVRDRPRVGFALLAVGGLVKLFPLLLAPVAAAWLLGRGRVRAAWQGLAWCAGIVAVGVLPFLVASPHGLWGMVDFHLHRPVQIEATAASVLLAFGGSYVTGTAAHPDPYKSNGLAGGEAHLVTGASTLALLVVLVACVVLAHRHATIEGLLLAAALAVLGFVALGKVLSPQYMTWLAPFAALALARRRWAIGAAIVAACVLTLVWFPDRYFDLVARDTTEVILVAVRNACLLTALVATARALARSPSPAAAAIRSG